LRLKILKNLRTASLNSEFTGSYKKKVYLFPILRLELSVVIDKRGHYSLLFFIEYGFISTYSQSILNPDLIVSCIFFAESSYKFCIIVLCYVSPTKIAVSPRLRCLILVGILLYVRFVKYNRFLSRKNGNTTKSTWSIVALLLAVGIAALIGGLAHQFLATVSFKL